MKTSFYSLLSIVVVAVAFVLGLVWASTKLVQIRRTAKEISVTGHAEENVTSDVAVFTSSFSTPTTNDIKGAYQKMANDRKIVEEFFKQKGIPANTVSFETISMQENTEYTKVDGEYKTVKLGYILRQPIRVVSNNVDLVDKVSREMGELLDKGVFIDYTNRSFYYSKLKEKKLELLRRASEDARSRADAIANGSKCKVGKLQRSQMGVFQISGLYANEEYSWAGNFNTSDKEKTITVTVKNSYAVH